MVRYKLIFSLLLFGCFYSCSNYVPNRIKKNFSYCYNQNIDYSLNEIKKNGYYILKYPPYIIIQHDKEGHEIFINKDTSFSVIIFFNDGLFTIDNNKDCYNEESLLKIQQKLQPESNSFYNWNNWGIYKINSDTIKLHYINHQPWYNPYWTSIEVWYKMIDTNTLKTIFAKDYIHSNKVNNMEEIEFSFVETNFEIESDCWLKREKWFWCNEKEWKEYMDSLKLKKKGKED